MFIHNFVFLWIFAAIINETKGYCLYGGGPDCTFPCNCANKAECTTGCQPTGCATGPLDIPWQGPGCQIGNVALGKNTNQTGGHPGWIASHGVDGQLPVGTSQAVHEPVCAHPTAPSGQLAEWGVDLGGIYKISSVIIYNRIDTRNGRRTSMFTISMRNSSAHEELCYDYNIDHNPGDRLDLTCNKPVIGRYIRFARKSGGFEPHVMNFCEFIAFGHRYIDCSALQCEGDTACNEVTGCESCLGSYPPDCLTACEDGFYGVNCQRRCGHCAGDDVCDKTTGHCLTACEVGFYGGNCQGTCGHCAGDEVCDKTTGHCPDGCKQWWTPEECQHHIVTPEYHNETTSVSSTQSSSVHVIWQPLPTLPSGLSQFYGYTVYYRQSTTAEYTQGPDVPHSTNTQATITGLVYNTEYHIEIRPYRELMGQREYGNPYPVINQKTKCGVPEKPMLLSVEAESGSVEGFFNIKLDIAPIMELDSMCDSITKTVIQYRHHTDATYTEVTIDPKITSFSLTDIPEGDYDITISVFNNQDVFSSSDMHTIELAKEEASSSVSIDNGAPSNLAVIIGSSVAAGVVVLAIIVTTVLVVRRRQRPGRHEQQAASPTSDQQFPVIDASINKLGGRGMVPQSGASEMVPLDDVVYETVEGDTGQENPTLVSDDGGYTHLKK